MVMMCADREYGGADVTGADPDLVYDGRLVKRPPGASEETQEIYRLLHEHPDGMTVDLIHDGLRDGWMATDVYRAYAQNINSARARRSREFDVDKRGDARRRTQKPRDPLAYGTPAFKEAAQRWAITRSLLGMKRCGTARRVRDLRPGAARVRWVRTLPGRHREKAERLARLARGPSAPASGTR